MSYFTNLCPICNKHVSYWANCSKSTNPDYGNIGWIMQGKGKFKTKQYFHLSCLDSIKRGK